MTVSLSPQDAATALSAAAADLSAALADEGSQPLVPVVLLDRACALLDRLSWALCREPAGFPVGGLAEIARSLAAELAADSRGVIADDDALDVQALAVTIQASELDGAYRRWSGQGRRPANRDDLEGEVAHLLITTAIFAEMAGIDIDQAIGRQVTVLRPGARSAGQAAAAGREAVGGDG